MARALDLEIDDVTRSPRIDSLDILRGLACVLMAIDHVRVYAGVPAGGPTAGVFFTRWVTHFVAPAFCFLAGTGAFLHGRKLGDLGALSRFLVSRGLILVALELTVIKFSWTFDLRYDLLTLMGVIWMLGWCMVVLGLLVRLPARTVGYTGLGIMLLQQLFSFAPRVLPAAARERVGWVWEFIYPAGLTVPGSVSVLYVLVPWIGVMAAGYGFGLLMLRAEDERRRLCLRIGLGSTLLFVVVAGLQLSLGAADAGGRPWLFRLLEQPKYPASQLFLLMTLGPMIALIPFAERWTGWAGGALRTFGRVPMFYYLLHIPLIHLAAIGVMEARGTFDATWYATAPYAQVPPQHQWPLWLLYAVWAACVALLHAACRWYARVKQERPAAWMAYL